MLFLDSREAHVATFDVTEAAAVEAGIDDVEARLGTPDILVNNAGIQRRNPIADFTDEDWHDLVATNLTSAFLLSRRAGWDHAFTLVTLACGTVPLLSFWADRRATARVRADYADVLLV